MDPQKCPNQKNHRESPFKEINFYIFLFEEIPYRRLDNIVILTETSFCVFIFKLWCMHRIKDDRMEKYGAYIVFISK